MIRVMTAALAAVLLSPSAAPSAAASPSTATPVHADSSTPAAAPAGARSSAPAATSGSAVRMPSDDLLSRFFVWWNETYRRPGGYTAEAFGRWFTPDATLVLEGREVIRGLDGWAAHFQKIQAGGGDVEIVVPFKQVFRSGNRIYTYHVIRSRRDGKVACSLAAGHAELRGDRIATIVLVRSTLDPAKGPLDPECWTK